MQKNLLKSTDYGEKNGKMIWNQYPGTDHHQKLITYRRSLLPMSTIFGRRPLPWSWVILLTEWQMERPIALFHQPWPG